jgi:hypothetical protein
MKKLATLGLLFLLTPVLTFAAGFVPDSIWLSSDSLSHGDVVDIFVTIFNTEDTNLSGIVRYYDDELLLGEVPVTISSNSAKLVDLSWEATQGDRVIFARFSSGLDAPEETKKLRFKVKKPIIPEPLNDSEDDENEEAGESFRDFAGQAGETVVQVAEDGFEISEGGRETSVNFLEQQKEKTENKKAELLAGENEKVDSEFEYNLKKVMLTALLWLLSVLIFVTSSKIAFYIVIVLLIYGAVRLIRSRRDAYYD